MVMFGLPSEGMFSARKVGMGRNMNRWQRQQLIRVKEYESGKEDKYNCVGNFLLLGNLLKVKFCLGKIQFDMIM